jgi:hypothetical protein
MSQLVRLRAQQRDALFGMSAKKGKAVIQIGANLELQLQNSANPFPLFPLFFSIFFRLFRRNFVKIGRSNLSFGDYLKE